MPEYENVEGLDALIDSARELNTPTDRPAIPEPASVIPEPASVIPEPVSVIPEPVSAPESPMGLLHDAPLSFEAITPEPTPDPAPAPVASAVNHVDEPEP